MGAVEAQEGRPLILVDTCVWIEHVKGGGPARGLVRLLDEDRVVIHPWIVGELSLGRLGAQRSAILEDLGMLPRVSLAGDDEVKEMIEARSLSGTGIGWVDAHLVASALISGALIWTLDRTLGRVAGKIGVRFGAT